MTLMLVGLLAGLATLGTVNGARTLFGLMTVLFLGAEVFGITEGARIRQEDSGDFLGFIRSIAVVLSVLPAALAIILLVLPKSWGLQIVGDNWPAIRLAIVPMAVMVAGQGLVTAYRVGLRGMAAAKASLQAQTISAPLVLGAGTVGALGGSATTTVTGMAIGFALSALVFRAGFRREVRL
jgi:hypothetical protein